MDANPRYSIRDTTNYQLPLTISHTCSPLLTTCIMFHSPLAPLLNLTDLSQNPHPCSFTTQPTATSPQRVLQLVHFALHRILPILDIFQINRCAACHARHRIIRNTNIQNHFNSFKFQNSQKDKPRKQRNTRKNKSETARLFRDEFESNNLIEPSRFFRLFRA